MCVRYMQILQPFYVRDLSICGFWYPVGGPRTGPLQIPRDDCTIVW